MGMYTEYLLRGEIKDDAPQQVRDVLTFLASRDFDSRVEPSPLPDHPFFVTDRWDCLGSRMSYYFPGSKGHSEFSEFGFIFYGDLKNYDQEIAKFVDWIMPHLKGWDNFIGYELYEEFDQPILYHYKEEQ
ncbi:MAG: hypothetical protein WAS05_00705 [Candidatus Nanopelagicales bacterium]